MEDLNIIAKLKSHDDDILGCVINKYGGYVYSIIRNIGGSALQNEDIEELVCDIFVTIWQNSEKLDATKPLKPYLIAVARNAAKNRLRSLSRHAKPADSIDEIEIPYEDVQTLEKEEQIEIIDAVLSKADSTDREIFLRYYYEYEKISSIAKAMSLSESAVKMKLHRTRKILKNALAERGYLNAN